MYVCMYVSSGSVARRNLSEVKKNMKQPKNLNLHRRRSRSEKYSPTGFEGSELGFLLHRFVGTSLEGWCWVGK